MPIVTQFLTQISQFLRDQNGDALQSWLQVDSNASKQYFDMAAELRASFGSSASIDHVLDQNLPQGDAVEDGEAAVWPGFIAFMKDYLIVWRDVDFNDLRGAHELLSGLVK